MYKTRNEVLEYDTQTKDDPNTRVTRDDTVLTLNGLNLLSIQDPTQFYTHHSKDKFYN